MKNIEVVFPMQFQSRGLKKSPFKYERKAEKERGWLQCDFHRRQFKKSPFTSEWKIEKNLEVVFT